MISTIICAVVFILTSFVYFWLKHKFNYWSKHNLPTTNLLPFNLRLKLKHNLGVYLENVYKEKTTVDHKVVGIYAGLKPALMLKDANLIEEILLSDYETNSHKSDNKDLMSSMTMFRFNSNKDKHKQVLPIFKEQNLKEMYPLMEKVAKDLERYLLKKPDKFVTNVNNMISLYTSDITGNMVFGSSSNCLKVPHVELYHKQIKRTLKFSWFRLWKFYMVNFNSNGEERNCIKMFNSGSMKIIRIATDYVMCERERRNFKRADMINELVRIKREAQANDNYTPEQHDLMIALTTSLYATLYDSSFTLTYALYELAKHSKAQERLRREIHKTLKDGNSCVTFEILNSLNYLDMVINEILRLYPIYPFIYRKYTEATQQTFTKYLNSDHNYTPVNNTPIFIPIYALHHDPKIWPNPSEFDPERFSEDKKSNISAMSYLPFGNNPYDCFGSHFIVLTIKLGLFNFLKNHSVHPCSRTVKTVKFNPNSPTLRLVDNIYLEFRKDELYNKDI